MNTAKKIASKELGLSKKIVLLSPVEMYGHQAFEKTIVDAISLFKIIYKGVSYL